MSTAVHNDVQGTLDRAIESIESIDERLPRVTLALTALSDSFASLWPMLADELALGFRVLRSSDEASTVRDGILLLSAAGNELVASDVITSLSRHALPLAVVGADDTRRAAVHALQRGAQEYFALPTDLELLRSWLRDSARGIEARVRGAQFSARQRSKYRFDGIVGQSRELQRAIRRAERVIPHGSVTLLLLGETGTGKELFAKAIHYNGPRSAMPFVAINCAAIPPALLESELFGHERGAFTGATAAKPGLFEVAQGGTLLLDEIGSTDLALQGKLLRALEERTIRRVGGTRDISIDVRVMAATNVDLARASARGDFRLDLYFRLNVITISLPPLRERVEDLLPIARHFVERTSRDYGVPAPALSPEAEELILRHQWTGNVRELRNAMERATLLSTESTITPADLELRAGDALASSGTLPFPAQLHTIVRTAIREMLALCEGNKSEAARRLDISRPRLLRLLAAESDAERGLGT